MAAQGILRRKILSENASSTFLLASIYRKLHGRWLRLEHSRGDGLYFQDILGKPITQEMIDELSVKFIECIDSDNQLELLSLPRDEVYARLVEFGDRGKLAVLKAWQDSEIPVIRFGEFLDYVLEPMSTDKERLRIFGLELYDKGFVVRLATMLSPNELVPLKNEEVLHNMFSEYDEWAKLLRVENVGKLNHKIYNGNIHHIKLVAEGLHERKFASIAQALCADYEQRHVVTVAGPSSSNKTTFAKRLEIQLNVGGYRATIIEMDDYFRDTCELPFGPDGLQDFEAITAMNVELLGERVRMLLAGEPIPVRKFDFKQGKGVDHETKKIRLPDKAFLILEGIHGLNPELLRHIGGDGVVPIYVSALTPLNIDSNHRFPTSDLRLIRRIIRDNRDRGASPRATIRRWTSVRFGEEKNIFPYQCNAKLFFNSSLAYELPVLGVFAKMLLCEATHPDKGEDGTTKEAQEVSTEARRLLKLVDLFYPLSPEVVPKISCIREFVGGSEFDY